MTSDRDGAFVCPRCNRPMVRGWVGFWNPLGVTKVAWKGAKPGVWRFRVPTDAVVVLDARDSARVAYRCEDCQTIAIWPDPQ